MKLVVLGSGTSVPHPRRSSSAYWVEAGGRTLLLDPSAACVHRMPQENCDWAGLDAVWVSHFHLDHVGGGYGLKRLLEKFDGAYDYGLFRQPFPLEVREVSPRAEFDVFDGLRAETFSTPHTRESLAVRLTETGGGASLVYTSDTGYTEALAKFARGADLFLMECSFF